MKILLVGGGGREHALAWKIAQSPRLTKLYCAPGNPGMAQIADCLPVAAGDVAALRAFAQQQHIDLTVVGPEAPLAAGIADEFRKHKLAIFGPQKAAARIESSKIFAKELMWRVGIPTAQAKSFTELAATLKYLESREMPIVVKADGLAQGKGVVVAHTRDEARQAATAMLESKTFGEAGSRVVIEEYLAGEEITVMAFTDGKTVVPMLPAQDHKRLQNGEQGPNTGGMGAYAPAPLGTPQLVEQVQRLILEPAIEGLSQLGSPFQGVIYAGVMMTAGGPKVLEFNARMGDPETQVILPLLKTDLVDILVAVVEHRLDQIAVQWHAARAVCIVLAAAGYPGPVVKGTPIHGLPRSPSEDVLIFHAGTGWNSPVMTDIVTAGGRVLGVTGLGRDFTTAQARAYAAVQDIRFDGMQYRSDIGARAFT